MQTHTLRRRVAAFAAGMALLVFCGWASADPPARVARLGYLLGAVSFSPAGEADWDQASLNRPLGTGDRLWTDQGARAEIQVGAVFLRMDAQTSVALLNLDDRVAQLQLTQGTLSVRVRRLAPGQLVEVDTPNLALTLRQPGDYRISVDPQGDRTDIAVRRGQGEAFGEGVTYVIDAGQAYRFSGIDWREHEYLPVPRLDEFDRWASRRDRALDRSTAARYVSPDLIGYQDLDGHGRWRLDGAYGNIWFPDRVAAGWAPYRDGHWAWVDPWGWTWIDDAPWGFAVSHYGRWAHVRGLWGWVPGPSRAPAYYAPALVVFIGGNNFQLPMSSGNVGAVAWYPLAPREIYRPSYPVSRAYFTQVNHSNTVVNSTVINNSYTTYNTTQVTQVIHANRAVPGAVIAVPQTTFAQSQPVSRAALALSGGSLSRATMVSVAPVAPTQRSVHGAAKRADRPPARVFERPVFARGVPAAPRLGFAAQREQLGARAGRPLDEAARRALQAPAALQAPVVKLLAPQVRAPTSIVVPAATAALPAPAASAVRSAEQHAPSGQRRDDPGRGPALAPPLAVPGVSAAVEPRPVPPAAPPPQRSASRAVSPAPPPAALPHAVPPPAPTRPVPSDQRRRGAPGPALSVMPGLAASVAAAPQSRPGEQRGRFGQRRDDPERAPALMPPAAVPGAPAQAAIESRPAPPPGGAVPVPPTRSPPPKPEPDPVAGPAQTRVPLALPNPPTPPQARATPQAEPKANGPRPAASRPRSAARGAVERESELKREQEERQKSR